MNQKLTEKIQPWYRHPWPWILMAGPFIVVIAGLVTAYLAVKSNDGLVDDDYYKQGLAVNKVTERDQKAVALGLHAEVMQSTDGTHIRVFLRTKPETSLPNVIKLRIAHPTRAGVDQNVQLRADGAGFYSGELDRPLTGRWHVALEDDKGGWRLTGDWVVEKNASLRMPAERNVAVETSSEFDLKGR